jgi:hypothetical protein
MTPGRSLLLLLVGFLPTQSDDHDPVVLDLQALEPTKATVVIGQTAWHTFTVPIRRFSASQAPLPPPAPVPPEPESETRPASTWAYYLIHAQKATPGQLALTTDPAVRTAARESGMQWRVLRSDQQAIQDLNLSSLVTEHGYPLLVFVAEDGTVTRTLESPMESDIIAACKEAQHGH